MVLLSSCIGTKIPDVLSKTTCTKPTNSSSINEIIIGNNDWINHGQTGGDPQNANELTVAQIKIPAQSAACTGFLINADTLITNNHCIGSIAQAVNVTAIFRDAAGGRETYSCDQFIYTSAAYDFTLVKCANSPGNKYGWVGLYNQKPAMNAGIYVVQENCDYISNPYCIVNKFVGFGKILTSQATRIYHDADTLGGSSGSPIFSEDTHQVLALHNAGSPATSTSPAMNAGVPMHLIKSKILELALAPVYEFGTAGNNGVVIPPGGGGNPTPTPTPTPRPTVTAGPIIPLDTCIP